MLQEVTIKFISVKNPPLALRAVLRHVVEMGGNYAGDKISLYDAIDLYCDYNGIARGYGADLLNIIESAKEEK